MTLFYYDRKHDHIIARLDLGDLKPQQKALVEEIIGFLSSQKLFDGRYRDLILAKDAKREIVESIEPGETEIETEFDYYRGREEEFLDDRDA